MKEIPPKSVAVIFGAGDQAKVVLDALAYSGVGVKGLLADNLPAGVRIHNYPVLGGFSIEFPEDADCYHLAIGNIYDRAAVQSYLQLPSRVYPLAVIHHTAEVSSSAVICPGAYVGPRAVVHSGAIVREFAMVNSGAILEHDSVLGKFSHLAPGAVTGGHVEIGESVMVGIGAMLRDHISIGSYAVIGMGAVVTKKVDAHTTVFGNPARVIRCA